MEIDTIALLTLSSIVVAGSSYIIWAVNCRRRVLREQVPIVEAVVPPNDWGVQNPVAHV